jgi:hypothetical protein
MDWVGRASLDCMRTGSGTPNSAMCMCRYIHIYVHPEFPEPEPDNVRDLWEIRPICQNAPDFLIMHRLDPDHVIS